MNENQAISLLPDQPIKIAVLAMGGQGGGVLADWIVEMAEQAGWWAQTTSVPGVAQRTGATIYYLELIPESAVSRAGRQPTLAMMPTPGDVDLVVAAELMEAGRAMQRGLVTPERTLLITSSHRSFAVAEKAAMGNGIADPNKVIDAGRETARHMLCFDLQKMAEEAGSVISASLFGAIAGSGALPFDREAFENTIRHSGKGVDASLRAFASGFEAARNAPAEPQRIDLARPQPEVPERAGSPEVQALLDKVRNGFPGEVQPMLVAGLRRLIDYQDVPYATEYLERMLRLHALDHQHGGEHHDWALTHAAARRLAVAMSYDDVIRVADLKTRGSRFERVRDEVGARDEQIVYTTEFMHPRLEEVCGTLPVRLGRWLENSPTIGGILRNRLEKGRRVRTGTLFWFLSLYGLAGMRRFRRRSLRHEIEMASIADWIDRVERLAARDYALAVEVLECRRLIKGYSGTHERGDDRFRKLMAAADRIAGQEDAAGELARLRAAAMADEKGHALEAALTRIPAPDQASAAETLDRLDRNAA